MKYNPLNKKIRTIHLKNQGTPYFSAIDICKVLTKGTHKSAKSYWHRIKQKDDYFNLSHGYINIKASLPSKTGKTNRLYQTDVLTLEDVLHLIKTIKHKNAKLIKFYMLIKPKATFISELLKIAKTNTKALITYFKEHTHQKLKISHTRVTIKYNLFGGADILMFAPKESSPAHRITTMNKAA